VFEFLSLSSRFFFSTVFLGALNIHPPTTVYSVRDRVVPAGFLRSQDTRVSVAKRKADKRRRVPSTTPAPNEHKRADGITA